MRRSEDFRRTVRRGVRAARRTVVVHALRVDLPSDALGFSPPATTDAASSGSGGASDPSDRSMVGFVVSKAVGTAVRRNRVRRRLRHLAREHLDRLPAATLVVVRALPPAATADADLRSDLDAAWTAAMSRLARR